MIKDLNALVRLEARKEKDLLALERVQARKRNSLGGGDVHPGQVEAPDKVLLIVEGVQARKSPSRR